MLIHVQTCVLNTCEWFSTYYMYALYIIIYKVHRTRIAHEHNAYIWECMHIARTFTCSIVHVQNFPIKSVHFPRRFIGKVCLRSQIFTFMKFILVNEQVVVATVNLATSIIARWKIHPFLWLRPKIRPFFENESVARDLSGNLIQRYFRFQTIYSWIIRT